MKILIDGDGCPVVDITIKIAVRYSLECIIVCDTAHYYNKEGATTVTVSKGADNADFALVNRVDSGDIVVTQDYGLAALALARKAIPINQNGMIYTNENIDALLLSRHTASQMRAQRKKLPNQKKRTAQQDKDFETALVKLVEKQLD